MRFTLVDAFVGDGFLGNRAAVAIVDTFPPDDVLTAVAVANRQPATAFVRPLATGEHHIRWFTPNESDFCGHGTLAAAHVIGTPVRFQSRAGLLTARSRDGAIALDLPALPLTPIERDLRDVLGARAVSVHDASGRLLVELDSEDTVRQLRPPARREHSIIVTAKAAPPYDFVSRYFRKEGDEDAVTGSAHCALAPFWSARLRRRTFLAYQASERGGVVGVELDGDRVHIAGNAVTVPA
jgi:predicted PhzF superfamily epimerase YddE/YHI9